MDYKQHRPNSDEVNIRMVDTTNRLLEIRQSFSDSSLVEQQSTMAVRKISKGSTLRLLDKERTPSPQRGLPAFRRGLIASGLTGGSLIAEVLLLNADVLGVAASPLMDFEDVPIEQYQEKKVMNNYFGIGLDAKIALDFDEKRELHGAKARSRSKLYMWYGMLGTKELLQRTYRNLEQRVHIECDGHRLQLPSLQGIVILNIPSYQGGANFWGSTKEDSNFSPQSYDDKILEVVAVFGVIHCATSRVVKLQNHRIAQCRHVKIIITGNESIPVQVDGNPWMQPPGYIQIIHKNRCQVLVRNRQFEAALKRWTERQAREEQKPPTCLLQMFTEEESLSILNFLESANSFVTTLKKEVMPDWELGKRIAEPLNQAFVDLQRLYPPNRKLPELSHMHYHLMDTVGCMKQLVHLTKKQELERCLSKEQGRKVEEIWDMLAVDLRQVSKLLTLSRSTFSLDQTEVTCSSPDMYNSSVSGRRSRGASGYSPSQSPKATTSTCSSAGFRPKAKTFTQWLRTAMPKSWKTTKDTTRLPGKGGWIILQLRVANWRVEDVGEWLACQGFGEYKENFVQHEIGGSELMRLERRDLKDLGVTKVGHIKRLQNSIQELVSGKSSADERFSTS